MYRYNKAIEIIKEYENYLGEEIDIKEADSILDRLDELDVTCYKELFSLYMNMYQMTFSIEDKNGEEIDLGGIEYILNKHEDDILSIRIERVFID